MWKSSKVGTRNGQRFGASRGQVSFDARDMLCDTSPTAVTPHPCVSEPILMRPLAPIGIAAGGGIDASDDCGVVRVDVDSHLTVSSALHGFVLPIPNVCVATRE